MFTNHHIAAALASERQRDLLEATHRAQLDAQPTADAATPVAVAPQEPAPTPAPPRDGRIGLRITRGRVAAQDGGSSSRSRERAGSR
jgi:hypothetical protein